MNFTVRELYNKKFTLIDVGSYKIRSLTWKLDIEEIDIIGYGEKRQEEDNFVWGEIENFKEVQENIALCLKKSEAEWTVEDTIINTLSPLSFLFSHHINHIRKNPLLIIDEEEIFSIIQEIEKHCFYESLVDIEYKSWYKKEEVKNIFSSILEVNIDGKKVHSPLGKMGKNIKISLVNIFIPLHYYQISQQIFENLGRRNIITIPFEYSLLRYFPEETCVLLNIWNTKTSLGIKKNNSIIWTNRINIGIQDLIKKIKDKYTQIPIFQIIKDLDTNIWHEEKKEFLEIFAFCIIEWLKEIIGNETCPHQFFFLWGWWNNNFLKKYFFEIDINRYDIKMVKKIEDIEFPELGKIDKSWFLKSISNLDLLSTILTYEEREEKKNDLLSKQLKTIIEDIEKTK